MGHAYDIEHTHTDRGTHGAMLCSICHKLIEEGEYRAYKKTVGRGDWAYFTQHRACCEGDPRWAALDAKRASAAVLRGYFDELDRAWRAVDACGGTGASEQQVAALDTVIACIEHLGGMDPALRAAKGYPDAKLNDDGGDDAYFRAYMFKPGRELSIADVADIQTVLSEHNDTLGQMTDIHHEGRMSALHEIGGQELVDAVEAKQAKRIDEIVAKTMARLKAETPGA